MPPDLGVLSVVPIDGILLVGLPISGRKPDALTVLIEVVNLSAFRQLLSVLAYRTHGQHDMSVRVSVSLVVDGEVGTHSF